MRKKGLAALLAVCLLFGSVQTAWAGKIYDIKSDTQIARGISVKTVKRLTGDGWMDIRIASADISIDGVDLTLLKDEESITALKTVKALAEQNDTAIAVNGDFFSWNKYQSGTGSPVGGEVKDGVMLTSPSSDASQFALAAQRTDGTFLFDYIDTYMTVSAPNGVGERVKHINKFDNFDGIVLFNRQWGEYSPGSTGFQVEVVVEDDKVSAINYNAGPEKIPENGYVLTFLSDHTRFLLDNFQVGDPIIFDVSYKPNFDNIQFAMGGGTLLVKDGKKAPITHNVSGRHPRTAFGVSQDGKKVYLVTVDGRQASSIGATLDELADILLDYGVYNGINLDGGGSTTMVTKSFGSDVNQVVNSPSEGSLRAVANGVGVKISEPLGPASEYMLQTEYPYVFVNSSIYIEPILVDAFQRKTGDADLSKIIWSVSDENGYVEDGFYHPAKPGTVYITAETEGISGGISLEVLDMPIALELNTREVSLDVGGTHYVNLFGISDAGYRSPLNLSELGISLSNDVVSISGNNLIAQKNGSCLVTFTFGGVSASMAVYVGGAPLALPADITKPDSRQQARQVVSTDTSFGFTVFGNTRTKGTLLEGAVTRKMASVAEQASDIAFFVGTDVGMPSSSIKMVNTDGYFAFDHKGCTFLVVDNTQNAINWVQWSWLINCLESSGNKQFVLLMPCGVSFKNPNEEELFYAALKETLVDKGKSVYVIHNGPMDVTPKDGIRFFSAPGVEEIASASMAPYVQYLQFYMDENGITYEIKNLFA